MAREHNDANILVMGGRTTGKETALDILTAFLQTEFAGGRHQRRIDKIQQLENR
jgi:ribose 5-phosphate isomerase B